MKELREKIKVEIKRIFKEERDNGRFSILTDEDADLLVQIVISELLTKKIKEENFRCNDQEIEKKAAELIFIAAPTGAGKDTLVRKIAHDNADKKYVVLNMDMFRSYYVYFENYLLSKFPDGLTDKTFAIQTNGFSYEIYYTIQRLLLENFPGTNIIITGTIRETDWVEETLRVFKSSPYTDYTNKMYGLAVPKKVCAVSAIERYLCSIKKYAPGTARYVSSDYYSDTTENFVKNFRYFESLLQAGDGVLDCIEIYKRSLRQTDFNEDTLLYSSISSKMPNIRVNSSAEQIVSDIVNSDVDIGLIKFASLLDRVTDLKEYLIEQGLYKELLLEIYALAEKENGNKPLTNVPIVAGSKTNKPGSDVGGDDGDNSKYPGSED